MRRLNSERHRPRQAPSIARPVASSSALAWLAGGLLCWALAWPVQAAFKDPLDLSARTMDKLDQRPVQALAQAGERLVAVGARGLIITSQDAGASWQQSPSPVQSDLLAVQFPTPMDGWVVGHDGVILHSKDGGKSWEKQLDGRAAKDAFVKYYQGAPDEAGQAALELIERNYAVGPALPLLGVWFEDSQRGFAVGSFGTLLATSDGGRTWLPWLDRIDNQDAFNLNAIRSINDNLYIAAESGMIYRLNRDVSRFEKIATGYEGSFFGLVGFGDTLLAYGLMGTVYRSLNKGATWTALDTPSQAIITAGIALPETGHFVLVNASGELLLGNGESPKLILEKTEKPSRYTGILPLAHGRFLISSLEGIRTESLSDASGQR